MPPTPTPQNYDAAFGHYWFKSAIDLAYLAERQHNVSPGVTPNVEEVKRLYRCAIADAKAAIDEMHKPEHKEWAFECMALIEHMHDMITKWESTISAL